MFGQCLSMEKEVLHLIGAISFKQDQLSSYSICAISNKRGKSWLHKMHFFQKLFRKFFDVPVLAIVFVLILWQEQG